MKAPAYGYASMGPQRRTGRVPAGSVGRLASTAVPRKWNVAARSTDPGWTTSLSVGRRAWMSSPNRPRTLSLLHSWIRTAVAGS